MREADINVVSLLSVLDLYQPPHYLVCAGESTGREGKQ